MSVPRLSALRGGRDDGWRSLLGPEPMIFVRYVLVSGAFGVPASIAQLTALVWAYQHFIGDYNTLTLNALWVFNFEFSLVRNFLLHCAITWRTRPSWRRLRHAHVAGVGASIIDLAAFNIVLATVGILQVAQVFSAGSGFAFNFLYNRFRTFSRPAPLEVMADEAAV